MNALANEDLRKATPSVFALEPWQKMSDKYRFIPTISVVEALRAEGFLPVKAMQGKVRVATKAEFTKHILRFRRETDSGRADIPEIVLINSHDGTSSYKLMLGIFRLVCSNGLVVGDTLSQIRAIHAGGRDIVGEVIDASYRLIGESPRVLGTIEQWRGVQLDAPAQLAYAKAAVELNPSSLELKPESLLIARRWEDRQDNSLYCTFNRVQENFVKGGVLGRSAKSGLRRTRALNNIQENVKLNKALWRLTEEMAKLH